MKDKIRTRLSQHSSNEFTRSPMSGGREEPLYSTGIPEKAEFKPNYASS
jgi:hypothetical protein